MAFLLELDVIYDEYINMTLLSFVSRIELSGMQTFCFVGVNNNCTQTDLFVYAILVGIVLKYSNATKH